MGVVEPTWMMARAEGMSSSSQKRKSPISARPSSPDTKRIKRSSETGRRRQHIKRDAGNAKPSSRKPQTRKRQTVDASALAWQTIDEEEFGGLQVVDNVQVLREDGKLQFLVSSKQPLPAQDSTKHSAGPSVGNDSVGSEEFEGFDDTVTESASPGTVEAEVPETGSRSDQFDQNLNASKDSTKVREAETSKERSSGGSQSRINHEKRESKARIGTDFEKLPESTPGTSNAFAVLSENEAMDQVEEEVDDVSAWQSLGLSSAVLSAISKLGFSSPTKIQQKAIPQIMEGNDVIGKAETGSGKTLAFGIPILERWYQQQQAKLDNGSEEEGNNDSEEPLPEAKIDGPFALILSPTRELAKQIGDHLTSLFEGLDMNATTSPYVAVVTGGLSIQKQQRQLRRADVVIGTPGRLWEVLEGNSKLQDAFGKVRFLVVDEADRLFKAGQFREAQDILGALGRSHIEDDNDHGDEEEDDEGGAARWGARQTLVFSATFDQNLQTKLTGQKKLAGRDKPEDDRDGIEYLMKSLEFNKKPIFVDVNPVAQMAEGLKEGLIECGAMEKDLYLYTVLLLNPNRRTLIFTNSISAVRRLTPLLQNLNLDAHPIHSQMIQKARLRSLERFAAPAKQQKSKDLARNASSILVATDVAARGLDIKNIDQVIHYHVPRSADTYVHRSGRTARGNSPGVSILLCAPDEVLPTRRLAAKVHADREKQREHKSFHMIQSLPIDRKIASRLKPRLDLAKTLADAVLAKEKANSSEQWLRSAATDLGVDCPSDMSGEDDGSRGGRGGGRKKKEKRAREMTKAEMKSARAQLREELVRRVNLGVSEKYVTGGRVDVGKLLKEREAGTVQGVFIGGEGLGLEF